MLQKILKYWYEQEFFNPCWPVDTCDDTDLTKKDIPWQQPQNDPQIRVSYDVYLGKARSNDLIIWMLNTQNLHTEDTSIENDNSLVCLCALKIDENGMYVADSFVISSFVWAICELVCANSLNMELDESELEKFQQDINDRLLTSNEDADIPPITKEYLDRIYKSVCKKIKLNDSLFRAELWARKKVQHANKEGKFPPLAPSTELMQSFYLKDLKKIKMSPTQRITSYTESMIKPTTEKQRIQIDTDVAQIQQWLKAASYPLGAWPSQNSPSLMQQLGINIAITGKQSFFSVNGPPGTGKTTLLKEIVVSNIIQRAIIMTGYDSPEKAFKKEEIKNPPDQYNQSYYKLDKKLSAYGMIVASNNNAAVENISVELPKAIEEDRTGRFCNLGVAYKDTYFADVATKLLGEPAWGLISAKLGKKSNLNALKDRLWWADDEVTLKRYYQGKAPDWNKARVSFSATLKAVIDEQMEIAKAQSLLVEQETATADQLSANIRHADTWAELCRQQEGLLAEQHELNRLEKKLAVQQQNIITLRSSLSFLKRIFWQLFKNSPVIQEWKKTEQELQETAIQITKQRNAYQAQKEAVEAAQAQHLFSERDVQQAEENLHAINVAITPYQTRFGVNWADAEFWQNISENKRSQTVCPWTFAEYDKLREELFYQALMLHKAFILNCDKVRQNLMRLFTLWDGKLMKSDCEVVYGDLLNTLLLVVPVVSTTFASVQTFLEGIQAEELGILVVDEAGQATPQSALGAIWRTQKSIIVGDPLQVEPIVTIPAELLKRLADKNVMPPIYRLPELSVQMLADQLNPYGGIRNVNGVNLWLGCPLVVHRRCLDPMFQISNEVAYNERMFIKTKEPDSKTKFLLSRSVWLDIKGTEKGNKNHTVAQQIDVVTKLISEAIEIYGGLPDLYIITPFTSVEQALKSAIRLVIKRKLLQLDSQDIADWLKNNCGTIHTFQGKEANEVLLVLGCDAQSGKRAAQWVGQKPNIINVAVSRAKFRLGVIGDYSLWQNIPYVRIVCKYLTCSNIF